MTDDKSYGVGGKGGEGITIGPAAAVALGRDPVSVIRMGEGDRLASIHQFRTKQICNWSRFFRTMK